MNKDMESEPRLIKTIILEMMASNDPLGNLLHKIMVEQSNDRKDVAHE